MGKSKLVAEDLRKFQWVSDAQISPDGKRVAFVLTRVHPNEEKDTYESHIWVVSTRRGVPYRFTSGEGRDMYPRWSPDGQYLLFLSTREEEKGTSAKEVLKGAQLWVIPSSGGEARQLTNIPGGVQQPQWSPDGRRILFLSSPPDEPKDPRKRSDVKVIRRVFYRLNAEGYFHNRRQHIYTIGLKGGKPVRLTSGDYDVDYATFSPDGSSIAFIANRTDEADYTAVRDIFILLSTGGEPVQITRSQGPILQLSWSPDAQWIAYTGHDMRKSFSTNVGIWKVPVTGGEAVLLTRSFNRSVGNHVINDCRVASPDPGLIFSPDGSMIYFLATDGGRCQIFTLHPDQKKVKPFTEGNHTIASFSFSRNFNQMALSRMDATHPAEVWVKGQGSERRLTHFNDKFLSKKRIFSPEHFSFTADDGEKIEGWILSPPRQKRRKVPAILQIHGGPRTAYGEAIFFEFQLLASAGFAVIYTNPRGSIGYGEDFAYAIHRKYGEKDYKDLMQAMDYVLKKYPWIDSRNLGVTGGSYGGFMTNWIVGHTNRFKAAVTQRSISNFYSFYGTSDIGYLFGKEEVGWNPWENEEEFLKRSPIRYVKKMTTPLLILHSEEDWRCPIEQAEQLFVALKMRKREVELVRFPGENHELSRSGKPKHRIQRLQFILAWFKKYLQNSGK